MNAGIQTPLDPVTFEHIENLMLLPERIVAGSVTALGALGMLLAVVGLFGAISYSVSARKKELGLRIALGAQPRQLLRMIFRETLSVAGTGTMIGIAFGVALTVAVRSHFYRIGAFEWSVLDSGRRDHAGHLIGNRLCLRQTLAQGRPDGSRPPRLGSCEVERWTTTSETAHFAERLC